MLPQVKHVIAWPTIHESPSETRCNEETHPGRLGPLVCRGFAIVITIRVADAKDISAISRLLIPVAEKQVAHEFGAEGTQALLGGMNPEAIANKMLCGYRYYLAIDSGRLVGVLGMRGYSHIYHLFVDEQAQGQGIGRLLFDTARQESLSEVSLSEFTVFSSHYAEEFYRTLGFRRTGDDKTKRGVTGVPMKLVLNRKDSK